MSSMDLAKCRHLSDYEGTLHLSIVSVDFNAFFFLIFFNAIFNRLKLPEKFASYVTLNINVTPKTHFKCYKFFKICNLIKFLMHSGSQIPLFGSFKYNSQSPCVER